MKELHLDGRQVKLFHFVKEQHGEQKRKYTGEPYYVHLMFVAAIIQNRIKDPELLIEVALCHDLFEDTKCGHNDLKNALREFGYKLDERSFIGSGVEALTDFYTTKLFPELNRSERKKKEVLRMKGIEPAFMTVKYADLIHNTQSIVEHDPGFAAVYLKEKKHLLMNMMNGDWDLYNEAVDTLKRAFGFINGVVHPIIQIDNPVKIKLTDSEEMERNILLEYKSRKNRFMSQEEQDRLEVLNRIYFSHGSD